MNKEAKLNITISVDTTELNTAIQKVQELHELQEKVNRPSVTREPIHDKKEDVLVNVNIQPFQSPRWGDKSKGVQIMDERFEFPSP